MLIHDKKNLIFLNKKYTSQNYMLITNWEISCKELLHIYKAETYNIILWREHMPSHVHHWNANAGTCDTTKQWHHHYEVARLYFQETFGIHTMVGYSNIMDSTGLKRSWVDAIHMDGANATGTQNYIQEYNPLGCYTK
jgi:hypothetical protein